MRKTTFYLVITATLLLVTALSCSFSASTANISEAWMASDEAGSQRTTTFGPGDTFYAIVQLANAPDDTKVRAEWTAVNVEGTEPNTAIDQTDLTTGSGNVVFQLNNSNLWPAGEYKVDLFLNDKLDQTLTFQVQ